MKKTIRFLSLAMVMLLSTTLMAQETPKLIDKSVVETLNKTPNIGFGVSEERPLRSAFMMYEQLKQSGVEIENYEIVIWSKVVKDIKDNKDLHDFISDHMNEGITVSVCAVAMNKLGVTKEDLPKGIQVVDNAYVRIFELQALGYNFLIP
jgi:intracellular sulfur oxidation DsrE/DsrF family protein